MNFQIILWIALPFIILFLLYICLSVYKRYLRYSTKIKTPNGISSLEQIPLGDLKKWIFIRGTDQNNPVLIFLHGDTGEPALGMSSSRKLDVELIKHFTVVHWDQRGAGKSYSSLLFRYATFLNRIFIFAFSIPFQYYLIQFLIPFSFLQVGSLVPSLLPYLARINILLFHVQIGNFSVLLKHHVYLTF